MNIEYRFLQKAIEDKNFVCFSCERKSYKRVKPLKIFENKVTCDVGNFEVKMIKKLTVLKERF
ncbi:hypothetical protein [Halarcobacter sp.]|uniref:hypothetical protein n=1 Tax=Halarcobacter sp. TaxID=2321133 RepID=UPI0029F555B1|nr:hypothetical protein [Halarcobacter sp.]